MSDTNKIKNVIDKHIDFINELGGNSFISELVPDQMVNNSIKPRFEGIIHWNAIKSTVGDKEIIELEDYFNHKLPESYISFLKHRHFIQLQLGTYSVNFFKNLPSSMVDDIKEEIEEYYSNLIERNFIPFATLSDYGVLCFDANNSTANNEYSIVSFDHEDEYETPKIYSVNFASMFDEFEEHLKDWIKNKRNESDS